MSHRASFLRSLWISIPKPQRLLVIAGSGLTAMLVGIGVGFDLNVFNANQTLPSLGKFFWDTAKGTLLGTIALAVVNNIRAWGSAWTELHRVAPAISAAGETMLSNCVDILGAHDQLPRYKDGFERVEQMADRLSSFFFGLGFSYDYSHVFDEEGRPRIADRVGPLESFSGLMSFALDRGSDALAPRENELSALSITESDVLGHVETFTGFLQSAVPHLSPRTASNVGKLTVALTQMPVSIVAVSKHLRLLSDGQKFPDQVEVYRKLSSHLFKLGAAFHSTKVGMEVVQYEYEHGRPYPFRDA